MLTLDEWLKQVPSDERVGQHFYNCCFHLFLPNTRFHPAMDILFNTTDENRALKTIEKLMEAYEWTHLPILEN